MALLLNQVTSSGNDMGAAGPNHAHGLSGDPGPNADPAGGNRFWRSSATWNQVDYASVTGTPAAGQLPGTATNDNAAAGNVGEYVTSSFVTGVGLSNNVPINITSISLTAGDWDVEGLIQMTTGAASASTAMLASISLTSASMAPVESGTELLFEVSIGASVTQALAMPVNRVSIAVTTTVYLNMNQVITSGSATGGGRLRARRVR